MVLAETVSIDGGVLLVALVVFGLMVALWCGLVLIGCRWAREAGHGSGRALVGWVVVAVLEVLPLVAGFSPVLMVGLAALAVQGWLYLQARAEAGGGDLE
jgi:hypothetical protein